MRHLKEYHDDYIPVHITSEIYREMPKKKMNDNTRKYIWETIRTLTDDFGIRENGKDNSIEYWDLKSLKKPTKILVWEAEDEWFYVIAYYNYRSICHKCDQLSGLGNCINNGYGV